MRFLFFYLLLFISFFACAQNGQVISLEDSSLHFETFGNGGPILIIRGGPGMNSEGFTSLAKELGKTPKAIIYDQRGTGKSSIDTVTPKTMTLNKFLNSIN